MNKLNEDIKKQGKIVASQVDTMVDKHNPEALQMDVVDKLRKKSTEIMAQMPKINDLEKALEVQDEDAELVAIKK